MSGRARGRPAQEGLGFAALLFDVGFVQRGDQAVDLADQLVEAGQAVITRAGERVRYSVGPEGAEYVAVCLPAFSLETAHRD